jgi:glycosyltransferase involved in cell wall biosynthesis
MDIICSGGRLYCADGEPGSGTAIGPGNRPMITVLFATRDRAEGLQRMLEALLAVQSPDGGWKLVVADNGSQDATASVLERYAGLLRLTVVHEPVAGKNRALNRAIAEIEGDLTVLTDDDVIPDHDWLVQIQRAALSHPEATVFGGTVVPLWPVPRPAFISQKAVNFSILYALNEQPTGWCEAGVIFGPNMAVRTSVFRDGFTFAEDVGPDNSRRAYVMGGESDFVMRVMAAGHRAWFVADARVQHMIRPNQLTEAWILQRYYLRGLQFRREGRGAARSLVAKQFVCSAGAALVRFLPPSWPRLWVLSRDRFFAGFFAADAGPDAGRKPAPVDRLRPQ